MFDTIPINFDTFWKEVHVRTKNFSSPQFSNELKQLCMCDQSVEKTEKFT